MRSCVKKLAVAMLSMLPVFASAENVEEKEVHAEEEEFEVTSFIAHHIADSHKWSIVGYKNSEGEEVKIEIPLPVIAYYDGQVLCCMSSAFDDGAEVEKDGNVYSMHHDKLHVKNAETGEEAKPLDLSITRNVASMFMSVALLLIVFCGAARAYKKGPVPHGGASFVEMLVLFVNDIAEVQIGKEKAGKFAPYLLTLFFFIWFNNLIGLVPFFPGSSNLSGNVSFTAVLAIFTFLMTNLNGSRSYWKHNLTVPGVPVLMKVLLVPIEVVSMFVKPFTLLIRLFANITGGHIIVISLISMIFIVKSYVMAVPSVLLALIIFVLELIFGALQAYIFTLLSALYIGLAVQDEEHH